MDWEYPVYTPPAVEPVEGSYARPERRALSREEAIAYICGDDPRPLLVLRECKVCNGTDDALLKRGADNEKTFLLARWFHCVKLPADVMEANHPFHALFSLEKPEHLFVCSLDGSNHDPLESQTSRTELWKSMRELLTHEYEQKPDPSLKSVAKLLDKMDMVDQRLNRLETQRDAILEEDGPKAKSLKKLEKKIASTKLETVELQGEVAKVTELELRRRQAVEEVEEAAIDG